MSVVALRNITVSFGLPPVLHKVNFSLNRRERVCLVGRNGAGKSTLMKLITGEIKPDYGEIALERGIRIAQLAQEVPQNISGKVFDLLAAELPYIDTWEVRQRITELLSRLALDGSDEFAMLSGGLKRRVFLAKALIVVPDLLLLDEPTNHLDIENIEWLEQFFSRYYGTLLFVTHDRLFLQKIATRIVELDRGNLTSWECDYATYLERKQEALDAQETQNALFDKRLAQEEMWVRQGIKARRTRNEGRVAKLKELRRQRQARREVIGSVEMQIQQTDNSGKVVIEVEKISYGYDQPIVKNFSIKILRGDKIGIIGPNGSGKTTLLRLLLGDLKPQTGVIKAGTKLQVAYFDQLRNQFDEEKTLRENIAVGSDNVTINGKPKHIISYLQDFLFSPERALSPVNQLSGGERNRLLLAKLFARPSNVLVLDEPTNDLDIETLELLETLLVDYSGTILLVSHDRVFLNNIVTSTIVFEGEGRVSEYVGDYDDWLRQRPPVSHVAKPAKEYVPIKMELLKKQLTASEKRELKNIPKRIEQIEVEQNQLHQQMADPEFYKKDKATIVQVQIQLSVLDDELKNLYQRWEALEKFTML
ncbi:ATP-binding protein Uup [Gammaproteobacteria bacterium]